MSFITVLIIAFHFIRFCAFAEYDRFAIAEKRNNVKACGSILADKLAEACGGIYNEKRNRRLDNLPDSDYYDTYGAETDLIASSYPFASKRSVSSILRLPLKRKYGGLVDECCNKWCTISELTSYCG